MAPAFHLSAFQLALHEEEDGQEENDLNEEED